MNWHLRISWQGPCRPEEEGREPKDLRHQIKAECTMGCFMEESDVGQLYSMEKYGVWENHLVNPVRTGLSLGRHTAHRQET